MGVRKSLHGVYTKECLGKWCKSSFLVHILVFPTYVISMISIQIFGSLLTCYQKYIFKEKIPGNIILGYICFITVHTGILKALVAR